MHDAVLMHDMALIEVGAERLTGRVVGKTLHCKFIIGGAKGSVVTFETLRDGLGSLKD